MSFTVFFWPQDHSCDALDTSKTCENYFSKLKLVYFFLVQYVTQNVTRDADAMQTNLRAFSERNVAFETSQNRTSRHAATTTTGLHCILRHSKDLEAIQGTRMQNFFAVTSSSIREIDVQLESPEDSPRDPFRWKSITTVPAQMESYCVYETKNDATHAW